MLSDAVLYELDTFHMCTSVLCDATLPLSFLFVGCLVAHEDRLHRKKRRIETMIYIDIFKYREEEADG